MGKWTYRKARSSQLREQVTTGDVPAIKSWENKTVRHSARERLLGLLVVMSRKLWHSHADRDARLRCGSVSENMDTQLLTSFVDAPAEGLYQISEVSFTRKVTGRAHSNRVIARFIVDDDEDDRLDVSFFTMAPKSLSNSPWVQQRRYHSVLIRHRHLDVQLLASIYRKGRPVPLILGNGLNQNEFRFPSNALLVVRAFAPDPRRVVALYAVDISAGAVSILTVEDRVLLQPKQSCAR